MLNAEHAVCRVCGGAECSASEGGLCPACYRFAHRSPDRPKPISAFDQARLMPLTFKTGKTIDQLLADERGWLDSLRRGDEVECDFRSGAGPEIGTITRVHGERTFTVQFRSGATVVEYDFVDGRMPNYTHRISPVRAVVK